MVKTRQWDRWSSLEYCSDVTATEIKSREYCEFPGLLTLTLTHIHTEWGLCLKRDGKANSGSPQARARTHPPTHPYTHGAAQVHVPFIGCVWQMINTGMNRVVPCSKHMRASRFLSAMDGNKRSRCLTWVWPAAPWPPPPVAEPSQPW